VCRQLLRSGVETIAVIAKDKHTFEKWQEEHQFYNTNKIYWRYISDESLTIGIKFTMLFLVEDFWKNPKLGELSTLIHKSLKQYGNEDRTFSTVKESNYNRKTTKGRLIPTHLRYTNN